MTIENDGEARDLVNAISCDWTLRGTRSWQAKEDAVALIHTALASARREALESAASIVNSKRGETFDLRGIVAEIRALIEKD